MYAVLCRSNRETGGICSLKVNKSIKDKKKKFFTAASPPTPSHTMCGGGRESKTSPAVTKSIFQFKFTKEAYVNGGPIRPPVFGLFDVGVKACIKDKF